jgi:hypothetical protein
VREWTREWWDVAQLRYERVTSDAVLSELGCEPETKRTEGLALFVQTAIAGHTPILPPRLGAPGDAGKVSAGVFGESTPTAPTARAA